MPPPMQPPLCHRTLRAPEPSSIIGSHAVPAMQGAPCIGPGCSLWLKTRNEKGQEIALGCADALSRAALVQIEEPVRVIAQVLAAWHNERLAESGAVEGQIGKSSAPTQG